MSGASYEFMQERDDGDYDIIQVLQDNEGNEVRKNIRIVAAADKDFPNGRPSDSDEANYNRGMRDGMLGDSDWTQLPDNLTESKTQEWATYRQALRDLPSHNNWPHVNEDWPVEPT